MTFFSRKYILAIGLLFTDLTVDKKERIKNKKQKFVCGTLISFVLKW